MDAAPFQCAQIIVADFALPFGPPSRGPRRHRRCLDRPSVGLYLTEIAAADEAERAMIEIVAIEFVDTHAYRAGSDEWIEVEFCLVEKSIDARHRLVSEIAADDTAVGNRIVRSADLRQQQELNIEHRVGRQDDQ